MSVRQIDENNSLSILKVLLLNAICYMHNTDLLLPTQSCHTKVFKCLASLATLIMGQGGGVVYLTLIFPRKVT